MDETTRERGVIEAKSLRAYFHEQLGSVLDRQGRHFSDDTCAYMVNLLHHFSRSDRFFEWYEERITLRHLAMLYGEAVHARNLAERRAMLRRLGDIALFIAGVFGPSLERKTVGVAYYINMGGGAYDWLSDCLAATGDRSLSWRTFRELAENFEAMVAALDDFADSSGMRGKVDVIGIEGTHAEGGDAPAGDGSRLMLDLVSGSERTWH